MIITQKAAMTAGESFQQHWSAVTGQKAGLWATGGRILGQELGGRVVGRKSSGVAHRMATQPAELKGP